MRNAFFVLFAVALIGCGTIDSTEIVSLPWDQQVPNSTTFRAPVPTQGLVDEPINVSPERPSDRTPEDRGLAPPFPGPALVYTMGEAIAMIPGDGTWIDYEYDLPLGDVVDVGLMLDCPRTDTTVPYREYLIRDIPADRDEIIFQIDLKKVPVDSVEYCSANLVAHCDEVYTEQGNRLIGRDTTCWRAVEQPLTLLPATYSRFIRGSLDYVDNFGARRSLQIDWAAHGGHWTVVEF